MTIKYIQWRSFLGRDTAQLLDDIPMTKKFNHDEPILIKEEHRGMSLDELMHLYPRIPTSS